jgi:Ca2+-binding EF-hand superfamily protein
MYLNKCALLFFLCSESSGSESSDGENESEIKVSLNDFVVMEMLRQKIIVQETIDGMSSIFKTLDPNNKGRVKLHRLAHIVETSEASKSRPSIKLTS